MKDTFRAIANRISAWTGTATVFLGAATIVVIWALTGSIFNYSDTWQLVINTGTTIVTFLMVFLVQHTQNRDSRALHLKLDEVLRSLDTARNKLMDIENCSDEELNRIERQFKALRMREERQKSGTH